MACQPCDSDPENDRKKYEQKKTEKSFEKRHTIYASQLSWDDYHLQPLLFGITFPRHERGLGVLGIFVLTDSKALGTA